jgi:hypothetical protein
VHQQCGSVDPRENKQAKEVEKDKDTFIEQEKFTRERLKAALDEEAANGKDHPLRGGTGGSGRGSGKGGGGGPRGEVIIIPKRKPDFLRKMKQFAEKEYEKEYYKKGTDWFYTQGYGDIMFKDRPKVSIPKKSVYILIDVSGSMDSSVDRETGESLLEYMIGYLPVIAETFSGEVWFISGGILHWNKNSKYYKAGSSNEIRVKLSDYKGKTGIQMSEYYHDVINNTDEAGGGTTFNEEFQALIQIRKKEKHNSPIIALTDGEIDNVVTEYEWPVRSNKMIEGKFPPNTYIMCFQFGLDYLERYGYFEKDRGEGYFSYSKNIQYYNFSKENRFVSRKR